METEEIVEVEIDIVEFADRGEQPPNARGYRFRIDGDIHTADIRHLTGEAILGKAGKRPCAYELLQELTHRENEVVDSNETVDLRRHGLRGFITAHKETVTIFVDDKPYPIVRGERTVDEILGKVDETSEGFDLRQDIDGKLQLRPSNLHVSIKGCEAFFTQVKVGTTS